MTATQPESEPTPDEPRGASRGARAEAGSSREPGRTTAPGAATGAARVTRSKVGAADAALAATLSGPRTNDDLQRADRRVLWHPFTQMRGWMKEDFPVITSAEGSWLTDADGRRYLDGTSSLWCALHGHRVPQIDAAVREQLDKVAHSTLLGMGGEASILLAEELVDATPGHLTRVFYSDSGSEAVEIGLKLAYQSWRHVEGEDTLRTRFIALQHAYHGDTIGSVSVGGIDLFHGIFGPLLFDVLHAPVPEGPSVAAREAQMERCLSQLGVLLDTQGHTIAALVLEPGCQGAAGIRAFPEGFTKRVVEMARKEGVLVIADEVATGFGRSGELWASEREGIRPDILCLAKGLSGGYLPLAATLTTERLFEAFHGAYEEGKTFFHGHTFTGNALACAAARASLALCLEPAFLPRARALGDRIEAGLRHGLELDPHVLEIRRYGTMFGVELVRRRGDGDEIAPTPFDAARRTGHRVTLEARERGAVLRPLGDTVVLMPPLSMSDDEADALVRITVDSVKAAVLGP